MHVAREVRGTRLRLVMGALLIAGATGSAAAGELYKCGKVFQDHPCEATDVQQRFSRTQGTFAIEQVNPNTDRDCAKVAADAMVWWNRMAAGEPLEKLHAEIQEQNISRAEKSQMRDVLTAVKGYQGTPRDVRSQFEKQCMAYKARRGIPTERELEASASRSNAANSAASTRAAEASLRRAQMEAQRAEAEARHQEALERAAAARARAQQQRTTAY